MTTQTIDEQINSLKEQLKAPMEKTIEEKINEIEELMNSSKKEKVEEERVLLNKINAKTNIINYLTVELETAKKMKELYEERLTMLREK